MTTAAIRKGCFADILEFNSEDCSEASGAMEQTLCKERGVKGWNSFPERVNGAVLYTKERYRLTSTDGFEVLLTLPSSQEV